MIPHREDLMMKEKAKLSSLDRKTLKAANSEPHIAIRSHKEQKKSIFMLFLFILLNPD
jgi:hypothetical protein